MADIAASDLTYTSVDSIDDIQDKYRVRVFAITTAAGDYPTGGLPLDLDKLGTPNELRSLLIIEGNAAGTDLYKFDHSANKIKVFQEGVAVYIEHPNTAYTSPNELIVRVEGW